MGGLVARLAGGWEKIGPGTVRIGVILAAVLVAAGTAGAQTRLSESPGAQLTLLSSQHREAAEEIVREIDDPATGNRWLLMRDPLHPGGPGQMILAGQDEGLTSRAKLGNRSLIESPWHTPSSTAGRDRLPIAEPPLIHAGERILVEEHSPVVDTVLEATAVEPARNGDQLKARLSIGGHIVDAIAIAPGRALLSSGTGVQP